MELGGNNGGFHGYRRVTPTTSGMPANMVKSPPPDINMALPPPPPPPPSYHHSTSNSAASEETDCLVREQDRFMPIANVIRIMRKILPPHAKISDDAKETIQECVSEFISFVTSEANERCQREQRKTITAEDVLWAMSKLGFDDYIEPLTIYLHRYREFDGGERGSLRGEPLVKRMMDNPGSMGLIPGFPYHPQMGPHHHGFFAGHVPPMMNGFHHQAGGDPSQGSVSCTGEPHPPQCKD